MLEILGILFVIITKDGYILKIGSTSSEVEVFTSKNKNCVKEIEKGLI